MRDSYSHTASKIIRSISFCSPIHLHSQWVKLIAWGCILSISQDQRPSALTTIAKGSETVDSFPMTKSSLRFCVNYVHVCKLLRYRLKIHNNKTNVPELNTDEWFSKGLFQISCINRKTIGTTHCSNSKILLLNERIVYKYRLHRV